jgi:ketosteroid isomerase-like protein
MDGMIAMQQYSAVAILAALMGTSTGCLAPGATTEPLVEDEIWALEQAYWESNRTADYEKIISLWDEQFLGWPGSEPMPIDMEAGQPYVRRSFPKSGTFNFEIEPAGIRVREDVAVNHYWVQLTTKDDEGRDHRRTMRITHTWIRKGGLWKLLGGMSWGFVVREGRGASLGVASHRPAVFRPERVTRTAVRDDQANGRNKAGPTLKWQHRAWM